MNKTSQVDSRGLAYLSQLLPFIGPAIYGAKATPKGMDKSRGAWRGIAGEVGGWAGGAKVGGLAAAVATALALRRGRGLDPTGFRSLLRLRKILGASALGGMAGGVLGAGEGTYQASKMAGFAHRCRERGVDPTTFLG